MEHYTTLAAYCQGINVSPPRRLSFDIRSFEENMKTVHRKMPPFKHEFYAIAVRAEGSGVASTGNHATNKTQATIFFNSPYQVIQWDIAPDWEGFYIIFAEDFYRLPQHRLPQRERITEAFPFLLVDYAAPISLSGSQADTFLETFRDIYHEFHADLDRSDQIIRSYVEVLLHKVARLFEETQSCHIPTQKQRDHDLTLVSRFKTLIEVSFRPVDAAEGYKQSPVAPQQVSYYADQLHVHPNHLNAVVKRITERAASEFIYQHMLSLAQSKLRNTTLTVKEIAYSLHYRYPNHFATFFKKHTGQTPGAFRKSTSSL